MEDLFICIIILLIFVGGFAIGLASNNARIIEVCKRQNNVYACDVIAVPVKPEGK